MSISRLVGGLKRNWNRPYFWRRQILQRFAAPLQRRIDKKERVEVVMEDWDNLIILDACRADLFADTVSEYNIDGEFRTVYSKGSGSVEFLKENFLGRDCSDIVYVTSNPFVETELNDPFYMTDHVWLDGWDEKTGTVKAETMIERARQAIQAYPKKRLIVHFMQPHYPFVGDITVDSDGFDLLRSKAIGEENTQADEDVWSRLSNGHLTKEEVWKAYESNLHYVLDEVEDLVNNLDGRTVISSDHGNALGEPARPLPVSVYGHPSGLRMGSLTKVPWFILDGDRRETITGQKKPTEETDDEVIKNRLDALGYR